MRKPVFGVSDQVRHKTGCKTIEYRDRLEISDLGNRGIVLSSENKGTDQLRCYCAADLHLCFLMMRLNIVYIFLTGNYSYNAFILPRPMIIKLFFMLSREV